jgi:hypothetical protein
MDGDWDIAAAMVIGSIEKADVEEFNEVAQVSVSRGC